MRVLVTGGAGFIGGVATARLIKEGYDVTVIDNLETGRGSVVHPKAKLLIGNYADPNLFRAAFNGGVEAVVHLAASMAPSVSIRRPKEYFRNNLIGSIQLLNTMLEYDVRRIVFASSACVYGKPSRNPVKESDTQEHVTPYGDTKRMFEHILEWYRSAYGISPVCFRFFNVAGAAGGLGPDKPYNSGVVPIMLKNIRTPDSSFSIFGTDYPTLDGTCVRDYVHVSDIADALLIALRGDCTGVYNLGSGVGYSVAQLADRAADITGWHVPVAYMERRDGDPAELVADITKAKEELGWTPRMSDIDTIIKDTWHWIRLKFDGVESE